MTRRLAIAGVAAALVAVAALLGGAFRGGSSSAAVGAPPSVTSERLAGGFAGGDTPTLIRSLQGTLRRNPRDGKSWALLGLAYQQRARETADPAYYPKSEGVLRRSLAIDPHDLIATSGLGSLELSRHRFADALALGRKAIALSPSTARNYGVIGDALVELGRYPQAFRAFDTFARLKPGLSSYSRISYARELLGDQAGAVDALRLAVDAAVDAPEASAWTRVQLGKLYWAHGRFAAAAMQYQQALVYFPGYVYAFDALASVEWARGHTALQPRQEMLGMAFHDELHVAILAALPCLDGLDEQIAALLLSHSAEGSNPVLSGQACFRKGRDSVGRRPIDININAVKDDRRWSPQKLRRDLARRDHRIHSADEEVR